MKFSDITNRLSEAQTQRLREAKTNENADPLFTSDKQLLTDDPLGHVTGGASFGFFDRETKKPK